jgi:hypothetical protein
MVYHPQARGLDHFDEAAVFKLCLQKSKKKNFHCRKGFSDFHMV